MDSIVYLCNLCKKILDGNSRTLPCFHQFCYYCLVNHFSERQRDCLGNESFKCPNCSEDVLPTELKEYPMTKEYKLQKVMQSLKATSFLSIWRQVLNFQNQKEKCVKCPEDFAVIFCKTCEQFMCTKCHENHKKSTLHINNEIVDLTMGPQKIKAQIMPTLQCRAHKKAEFKSFCSQCILFLCNKCVINHKSSSPDCTPQLIELQLLIKIKTLEMNDIQKKLEVCQNTILKENEDLKRMIKMLQSGIEEILNNLVKSIVFLTDRVSRLILDFRVFEKKQITDTKDKMAENDDLLWYICDLIKILNIMLSNGGKEEKLLTYPDIKEKWLEIQEYLPGIETKTKEDQTQSIPTLLTGRKEKICNLFQSVYSLPTNKEHQLNSNNNNAILSTIVTNMTVTKSSEQMNTATTRTTSNTKNKSLNNQNSMNDNSTILSPKKRKRNRGKKKKSTGKDTTSSSNNKRGGKKKSTGKDTTSSSNNKSENAVQSMTVTSTKQAKQNKGDNSVSTNKNGSNLKVANKWSTIVKKSYITLTEGGELLLCDTESKTLIKYHYNGKLLSTSKISGTPTAICTASKRLHFVTLPLQNQLTIVKISDEDHSIIIYKTIPKKNYSHLSRVSCGILACDFFGNVDLLNTNGDFVKNVILSQSATKEKSYLLSAKETGDIFWMLDIFDQKLSCYDLKGTLLNSFQIKETRIASIFVDNADCLFGCDEKTIYKINSNGTLNKIFTNNNGSITNFSLYFSHRTKKLFQCCYDNNNGFIKIFKMN